MGFLVSRVAHEPKALAESSGLVHHRVHRKDRPEAAKEQIQVPVESKQNQTSYFSVSAQKFLAYQFVISLGK